MQRSSTFTPKSYPALNTFHSLGMAHGDIKPQNVLVSGDQVKITDFGSSILPEEMYARGKTTAEPSFIPHLKWLAQNVGGKVEKEVFAADIYSLGVLLYHLVTSRLPHDTLSQVSRHTPFARPREINSSVCPALEEVVLRCLALEPSDHYWSVADLATVLRKSTRSEAGLRTRANPFCSQGTDD